MSVTLRLLSISIEVQTRKINSNKQILTCYFKNKINPHQAGISRLPGYWNTTEQTIQIYVRERTFLCIRFPFIRFQIISSLK